MNAAALIGLIFSPLAGALAFVISYEEYSHHHLRHRIVVQRSIEAAVVATLFFGMLSLLIGWLLPSLVAGTS